MDTQIVINTLLGLVAFFGGWMLKSVSESIQSLHKSDSELAAKVQSIEVLVAGQYVTRTELEKLGQALFAKLDKIEAKLDGKADK